MPYINQPIRDMIDETPLGDVDVNTPGELNYAFTRLAHNYLRANGESYSNFNDIIGALEGAKLELYRRRVVPYEDKKIEENGDV
jgi:hypothetical protein